MATRDISLATRITAEIRGAMAVQKKDKRDLAEVLGVHINTARRLWNGDLEYSLDQVDKIAAWLGIPRDVLLRGIYTKVLAVPA